MANSLYYIARKMRDRLIPQTVDGIFSPRPVGTLSILGRGPRTTGACTFSKSEMDMLVLGNHIIQKNGGGS